MTRFAYFILPLTIAGLAACGPSTPGTDPDPVLPPENTSTDAMPDLPGTETSTATTPAPTETAAVEETDELEVACSTVTVDGLCNIGFGMDDAEAKAAYGGEMSGDGTENASCYYLRPAGAGYGRIFMMVDGSMQRIDVRDTSVETMEGAMVGMSLDEVDDLYEGGVRTPNKYAPANEDLKVELGNDVYAIFEEGNDGKVRAYRVGKEPAVDFVEGCA